MIQCEFENCPICRPTSNRVKASADRDRAWIERELGDVPATGPDRRVRHAEFPSDAMIDTKAATARSEPGSWAY
ncbi:MAG TPA: hypothetical protein VFH85_07690 [Gammaproteobacteria bacterium]|nr:hypothetical protein [Gammaproteobacteria bacterium]